MVGLRFQAAARSRRRAGVRAHEPGRASTTDVMLAGNWKTSRMVAHYSAGAVARYLLSSRAWPQLDLPDPRRAYRYVGPQGQLREQGEKVLAT